MAVARTPASGGSNGLKVATIVSVVCAVGAVTWAIIMMTQQSDLQQAVDSAQSRAKQESTKASNTRQDMVNLAKRVVGRESDDIAAISNGITQALNTIHTDPRVQDIGLDSANSVVELLEEVFYRFTSTLDDLADARDRIAGLESSLEAQTRKVDERIKAFDDQLASLQSRYEVLLSENEKIRTEASEKISELRDSRERELAGITADRDAEQELRMKIQRDLEHERRRIAELTTQLAAFKTTAAEGSILQLKDGQILRTVPGSNVVYIDLGQRDGVRPGLTFSVYSPVTGVPIDGRGKATIEVTNPFETTSECRITSSTAGRPVLRDDIIANPVFDKNRKYRFAVVGDFDLDFDGEIEDPAGQKVARLIERWGGIVVDTVDSRTDFLILGEAPPRPAGYDEEDEDVRATAEPDEETANRAARRDALAGPYARFVQARNEAVSLSIPILTRTRFLHFIGAVVPANVPADSPALAGSGF